MADSEAERTEAATPRRIIRAREEGNVALSRELPGVAGLAAAVVALAAFTPSLARRFTAGLAGLLAHAGTISLRGQVAAILQFALSDALIVVAPIAGAALLAGAGVAFLQTRFLWRPETLMPDVGRLSPGRWLRRILSPEGLVEQIKAFAKLVILGLATWGVLRDVPALSRVLFATPAGLVASFAHDVLVILTPVLVGLVAIAILDLLWVRQRHTRSLRMSREELREEVKETEGDPLIKARLRQIRAARAKGRMLGAVKRATVVVANPTHYAVALLYAREKHAAPRVVAKGVDAMALRIREIARKSHVPVVVAPPLARALYRVELDREIAPEHYKAVAEIIAYVWRLHARGGLGRATPGPRGTGVASP